MAIGPNPGTSWQDSQEIINQYTANVSQVDSSIPTANVMVDTITGIVYTRQSAGVYKASKTNAFPETKTTVIVNQAGDDTIDVTAWRLNNNDIQIITRAAGVQTDSLLFNTTLEIKVYP